MLHNVGMNASRRQIYQPVLPNPDLRSGAFLPPGSGMNFSRIPDPPRFMVIFSYIIFRILFCVVYETWLLLRLSPDTVSSKKRVPVPDVQFCYPPFYVGCRIRETTKTLGSGINIPDPQHCHQYYDSWSEDVYRYWFNTKKVGSGSETIRFIRIYNSPEIWLWVLGIRTFCWIWIRPQSEYRYLKPCIKVRHFLVIGSKSWSGQNRPDQPNQHWVLIIDKQISTYSSG
jgi:hypothetical protein